MDEPFWMGPLLASWHATRRARPSVRVPIARILRRPLRIDTLVAPAVDVVPLCPYAISYVTPSSVAAAALLRGPPQFPSYSDGGDDAGFLLCGYEHRLVEPANGQLTSAALDLLFYADSHVLARIKPAERGGRVFADLLMEPGMPVSPCVYASIAQAVLAEDVLLHREPPRPKKGGPENTPVVALRYGLPGSEQQVEPTVPRPPLAEVLAVSPVHLEALLQRIAPPHVLDPAADF
jgi:hypothetical protein